MCVKQFLTARGAGAEQEKEEKNWNASSLPVSTEGFIRIWGLVHFFLLFYTCLKEAALACKYSHSISPPYVQVCVSGRRSASVGVKTRLHTSDSTGVYAIYKTRPLPFCPPLSILSSSLPVINPVFKGPLEKLKHCANIYLCITSKTNAFALLCSDEKHFSPWGPVKWQQEWDEKAKVHFDFVSLSLFVLRYAILLVLIQTL